MRLTPEEWIRQQLLHRLVEQLDYPASLDAVVYGNLPLPGGEGRGGVSPLMIIECKAETVPITQKTLDQAINYNRKLNVPHLLLYNGIQAIYVNGNDIYTSGLPRYADLLRRE